VLSQNLQHHGAAAERALGFEVIGELLLVFGNDEAGDRGSEGKVRLSAFTIPVARTCCC
jgi:hypothetical protein